MLKFRNLVTKIKDVIALGEEEEIEEEEEEEYQENSGDEPKDPIDDSDLDLDLPIDQAKPDSSTSRQDILTPYYQAMKKMNGFFPTHDFTKNPGTLPRVIKDMKADIESLTSEQERLKQVSDLLLQINSKARTIEENKTAITSLRTKRLSLERSLRNFEMFESGKNEVSLDLDSAEKQMMSAQDLFQSRLSDNEQIRREIARLKDQLSQCQEHDADLLKDLEDEKDSYNQLVRQLNTFQEEADGRHSQEDELEVAKLEEEVAAANVEWERLCAGQPTKEYVVSLEKELAQVSERYKAIVEEKENPQEVNVEKDKIPKEITELLVKYLNGDKTAIDGLREMFGWTEEQMEALKTEKKGLSGIIKQGARLFTGFRDAWTSWLIAAAED